MRPNTADWAIVIIVTVILLVASIIVFGKIGEKGIALPPRTTCAFFGLLILMGLLLTIRRIRWAFLAVFDWLFTRSR